MTNSFRLVSVLLGLLFTCNATADALITNQSMFATTIAEYFIGQDQVRVELEIGMQDLQAFRNLMPDEIYEKMGHAPRPYAERVVEFFDKDLVIATREGSLDGRLVEIGPRTRVRRDPISGDELPVAAGDEETVITAVLSYTLEDEPAQLIFSPPRYSPMPNVGFVVYHNMVAVNDFRFLGPARSIKPGLAGSLVYSV